MKTIPAEMTHYKSTRVFTEETPCCAPAQSYDYSRHLGAYNDPGGGPTLPHH
jgi:hypothetical protein